MKVSPLTISSVVASRDSTVRTVRRTTSSSAMLVASIDSASLAALLVNEVTVQQCQRLAGLQSVKAIFARQVRIWKVKGGQQGM